MYPGIRTFLEKQIGLNPCSVSDKVVESAIKERMKICGLDREHLYLDLLNTNEKERDSLINRIVVNETWFFRDFDPFLFLKKYICDDWLPSHNGNILRILCVPCSTGEEAYSIAMTMLEAGVDTSRFCIDAVDISKQALKKAEEAIYGSSSFRDKRDTQYRSRYFQIETHGMRLVDKVQKTVNLFHGNILDYSSLARHAPYDVIFCRNLLIYLTEKAREEAVKNLGTLLRDYGVIFLGFSETRNIFFPDYEPIDYPHAYAARKISKPAHESVSKISQTQSKIKPITTKISLNSLSKESSIHSSYELKGIIGKPVSMLLPQNTAFSNLICSRIIEKPVLIPLPKPKEEKYSEPEELPQKKEDIFKDALSLADQGNLLKANALCEKIIQQDLTYHDAYYLLGVIAVAEGDEKKAEENFNKTLYLKPNHTDALIYLSVLMKKSGRLEEAKKYKSRLDRLQKQ